jgi:TetR/AcrR family transcriptional repressor of nem operon
MPYTLAHKARTRERIIEAAQRAFSRAGYDAVRIDDVMTGAGLTRGGFYNHFRDKAELFAAAVEGYGLSTPWSGAAAPARSARDLARWMVDFYLSDEMLRNVEIRCPLYGLPNDVARAGAAPKAAYTRLIERTAGVFRAALGASPEADERAQAILALCVGAMLLASTTDAGALQDSLRASARRQAMGLLEMA